MKDRSAFTALGIDVGGTKIAAGLVHFPAGEIRAQKTIPTRAERPAAAVLKDTVQLAAELLSGSQPDGVGLALCELVGSAGEVLSDNCIHWNAAAIQTAFKHIGPVTLEADVRAAARAEAEFGVGRDFRIFLYVTIGTGISSCLMRDGSPYFGAHGATGTMASSPLTLQCENCGRVNERTLEEIASGPALLARYGREKASSAKDVVVAANRGEPEALRVVRTAASALGASIGSLVNVLDPEAVILGGGLGLSEGAYWEHLAVATRRHIWSRVSQSIPILRAGTGASAGILGAALAAWKCEE